MDQFYNNTIIALVVANLADEVLSNYGYAFGVPSNIIEYEFFKVTSGLNYSNNTANMAVHPSHLTNQENSTSTMIVDSIYSSALEISDRLIEIYNSELKASSSNSGFINKAKSNLSGALYDLRKHIEIIEIKENPSKIMEDVHVRIHPNLQTAFNLTLRR